MASANFSSPSCAALAADRHRARIRRPGRACRLSCHPRHRETHDAVRDLANPLLGHRRGRRRRHSTIEDDDDGRARPVRRERRAWLTRLSRGPCPAAGADRVNATYLGIAAAPVGPGLVALLATTIATEPESITPRALSLGVFVGLLVAVRSIAAHERLGWRDVGFTDAPAGSRRSGALLWPHSLSLPEGCIEQSSLSRDRCRPVRHHPGWNPIKIAPHASRLSAPLPRGHTHALQHCQAP
jgi:hypothetical protein